MPFRIVRNDITKMDTEAIVNTANEHVTVGTGCDTAVYEAAGKDELLAYRKEHIGDIKEGEVFITPGFNLKAKYIIHAVSPLYIDGEHGEEKLLRACYQKSLALARENGIKSIAFPLISTGGFGYPKEEGMRIAVDEISAFLLKSDMLVYLVVFDERSTSMGRNLYPDLEAYIDHNYVEKRKETEYRDFERRHARYNRRIMSEDLYYERRPFPAQNLSYSLPEEESSKKSEAGYDEKIRDMERKIKDRMAHKLDTFQQYLLYLIGKKGMENAEVYKRAIVDKKVFSKMKNNPDYHPQRLTALCLCIGAKLNMSETRDLLSRAGYTLSPSDKTDIIFSYFIENGIYDMIELDIQLEEYGLPCIIG